MERRVVAVASSVVEVLDTRTMESDLGPLKGNKVEAVSQSISRSSDNESLHDGVDGVRGTGPGVEVGT